MEAALYFEGFYKELGVMHEKLEKSKERSRKKFEKMEDIIHLRGVVNLTDPYDLRDSVKAGSYLKVLDSTIGISSGDYVLDIVLLQRNFKGLELYPGAVNFCHSNNEIFYQKKLERPYESCRRNTYKLFSNVFIHHLVIPIEVDSIQLKHDSLYNNLPTILEMNIGGNFFKKEARFTRWEQGSHQPGGVMEELPKEDPVWIIYDNFVNVFLTGL